MSEINDATDTFDYVIIGAGAAGCILANRLTEDGRATVCLLEAGPRDWHPFLHIPAGFIKVLFDPAFTWQFSSEPTANTNQRRIPIPQGRTLGGSTSINGLAYNRGQPSDFDEWAAAGNPGWGYEDVLPYFKRSERKIGSYDDAFRGRSGEQACDGHGLVSSRLRSLHRRGCRARHATKPGLQRQHSRGCRLLSAHYHERLAAEHRPRLPSSGQKAGEPGAADQSPGHGHLVRRENVRPGSAMPSAAAGRSHAKCARRREVIVCSGAINTPRLLHISGVGPASVLQSINVPVVHELPGVGENLKDHFSIRMVAKVKDSVTLNELARGIRLGGQIARWMVGLPNILALSPSLVHWFWRSREGLNAPDIQGVFTPASYREGYIGVLDEYPGMTCGVWQHRPQSTGYVRARSSDPFDDPVVQPNYLEAPYDRQVLLGGMRVARQLLRTPELAKFFDTETMPGEGVTSDDELLDYARRFGVSSYHVMGTSRMGPSSDPMTVVDDQLRVHGVAGLRIVDASIMPNMPSANTCASTMMIAEKAADMIRGLPPLASESAAKAAA